MMDARAMAHLWQPPKKPSLPLGSFAVTLYLRAADKDGALHAADKDDALLATLGQVCRAFAREASKLHSTARDWCWLGKLQPDAIAADALWSSLGLNEPKLRIDGLASEPVRYLGLDGDFCSTTIPLSALEADLFVVASFYSLPKTWTDYFAHNPQRKRQLLSLSLMVSGLTGIIKEHGAGRDAQNHRVLLRSLAHKQGGHAKHVFIFGGDKVLRASLDDPAASPAELYAAAPVERTGLAAPQR